MFFNISPKRIPEKIIISLQLLAWIIKLVKREKAFINKSVWTWRDFGEYALCLCKVCEVNWAEGWVIILPGPFAPPDSSRPKRKITALSYSCTTWNKLNTRYFDAVYRAKRLFTFCFCAFMINMKIKFKMRLQNIHKNIFKTMFRIFRCCLTTM